MGNTLLTIDTRDDRREVWHLLHRLPPKLRVEFLRLQCRRARATRPGGDGPVPSLRLAPTLELAYRCGRADERLTNEVYGDLLLLGATWGLDLAAAAVELEAFVRRPSGRAVPTASPAASSSPPRSAAARTPCSTR